MPETMQALRILGPGQAVWRETPVAACPPDEVLVRVEAVTTCPHWDLHILAGEPMFPGTTIDYPYPVGQPGHEMAGTVVEVGAEVAEFRVGDRVVAWKDPGKVRPGCYAQFVPFAPRHLLKLPVELSAAQAASLELAMCVQVSFNQLNRLGAVQDRRVVIGGLGPAGLIAVQLARLHGAREVLALDPLTSRRRLADALGADLVLDPGDSRVEAMMRENRLWDSGIDCTGLAPVVQHLMGLCRNFVHVFGVLREPVAFGLDEYRKGLALIGYASHTRAAARQALDYLRAGKLDLTPLATHTLPMREYLRGVDLLREKEAVKVRFLPWA